MINTLFATLVIAVILVASEVLWRKKKLRGELARKFVHIIAGTYIAFLPFWIGYGWMSLLALGFIAANLVNRYTHLFHAIHAITRLSWGDLFFGVGILLVSLLSPNKWLFAGAILQVAIADGFAAVVGLRYSKKLYKILGHTKSIIGTSTYFLLSFLIVVVTVRMGHLYVSSAVYIFVPLLMTALENVSGYGTDNAILPLSFLLAINFF